MINSEWNLVYCFSKKLAVSTERFNLALSCLENSIENNSEFHKLKIHTDKDTFKFVNNFTDDIKIIEYNDFLFLDDIKIQTLPLLKENEILIDIDIFLGEPLKINLLSDVILDRPSYITENYYKTEIEKSLNYKFSELLNYNPKENKIGNIGIMKFFNKELEKKYIDFYNKLRKTALKDKNTLPPFPAFSILLGQIGLKNIIDDNNYSISYTSKLDNNYFHLAGDEKYKELDFKKAKSRLNKSLI